MSVRICSRQIAIFCKYLPYLSSTATHNTQCINIPEPLAIFTCTLSVCIISLTQHTSSLNTEKNSADFCPTSEPCSVVFFDISLNKALERIANRWNALLFAKVSTKTWRHNERFLVTRASPKRQHQILVKLFSSIIKYTSEWWPRWYKIRLMWQQASFQMPVFRPKNLPREADNSPLAGKTTAIHMKYK